MPLARSVAKWTGLTILATVLGTALGTAVAPTLQEVPLVEEALVPAAVEEPVEEPGLDDTVAPAAPVPTTPADRAYVSWRPRLAWEPVTDASNVVYAVQVSPDPGFPPETTITVRNLEQPEWRPDAALAPLVEHHWRVYALDAGLNQGPWSEARRFTPLFPIGDAEAGVDVEPPLAR